MAELGSFSLYLALFLAAYAILIDIMGGWRGDSGLLASGRNAVWGCWLSLSMAVTVLMIGLLKNNFGINYVAEHSSTTLGWYYKISALWAGASGSLLLWLWIQVGIICLVFYQTRGEEGQFAGRVRVLVNAVSCVFLVVLLWNMDFTNGIDKALFATTSLRLPTEGADLNPLLQHPAMVLHPPTLFIGYAAYLVPCAWALAVLSGPVKLGRPLFFSTARNWILIAWLFLTVGNVLGSWWAYEELGWGGFWAWDPVENSSFMPWLVGTALLHCFKKYRSGSNISRWALFLCILTFSLCIFGTYLTRSALIQSVHTFPSPGLSNLYLELLLTIWFFAVILTPIPRLVKFFCCLVFGLRAVGGFFEQFTSVSFITDFTAFCSDAGIRFFPDPKLSWVYLLLLSVTCIFAVLFILKRPQSEPLEETSDVQNSRIIVLFNWLMTILFGVILVGTTFPWLTNVYKNLAPHLPYFHNYTLPESISLEAEYFTKITAPGGLLLLLLIGICPYFFRRGIGKSWHTFTAILAGLLAGAVWIAGYAPQSEWFKERLPSLIEFIEGYPRLSGLGDHVLSIPCFIICGYAGLAIIIDFIRPAAKKGADEAEGAKRNRRSLSWYGARLAHIGVVMMFLGIAGAEGFGTDEMVALRVGETKQVAQRTEAPDEAAKVGYEVTFDEIKKYEDEHKETKEAWITVNKNGEFLTKMQPARALYKRNQQTSEADIRRTIAGDLYLTLAGIDTGRQIINLRVQIKPLINWLWFGSIIMVSGALLVLSSWLRRRKTESPKSK